MNIIVALATVLALITMPAKAPNQLEAEVIRAMEYACAVTQTDCSHIALPKVRFATIRALGTTDWNGSIWLHSDLLYPLLGGDPRAHWVLVHEIVHYLDLWTGKLEQTVESVCASEDHAYAVSNLYLLENGLWNYARWNWRAVYPHCQS